METNMEASGTGSGREEVLLECLPMERRKEGLEEGGRKDGEGFFKQKRMDPKFKLLGVSKLI